MSSLPSLVSILPALILLALALLPPARRSVRLTTLFTGGQFAFALATLGWLLVQKAGWLASSDPDLIANPAVDHNFISDLIGLRLDATGALMLTLVSFVGWIVCRYSDRYLDGDRGKDSYYRWLGLTIGAVSLVAVSGSVLMLGVSLFLTSVGMHPLLLHQTMYGRHRPAASRAAWTKFVTSRLGDLSIATALVLLYSSIGTSNFDAMAAGAAAGESGVLWAVGVLCLAAIIKSAQFPFYAWIPMTMETPTPVSALLHAGIVNAGGFLLIRISGALVEVPQVMLVVGLIGGFTTVFAAIVMMTQTSVKTSLAYSTVAQMGFMILQCGLGAFGAAMLHLVAHSLYKAHSFLSSGNSLNEQAAMAAPSATDRQSSASLASWQMALVSACVAVALVATTWLAGVNLADKPGGIVLGLVIWLGFTIWTVGAVQSAGDQTYRSVLPRMAGLMLAYAISLAVVMRLVGIDPSVASPWTHQAILGIGVVAGFLGLAWLQFSIRLATRPDWVDRLRVHASAGFYVDAMTRRLLRLH